MCSNTRIHHVFASALKFPSISLNVMPVDAPLRSFVFFSISLPISSSALVCNVPSFSWAPSFFVMSHKLIRACSSCKVNNFLIVDQSLRRAISLREHRQFSSDPCFRLPVESPVCIVWLPLPTRFWSNEVRQVLEWIPKFNSHGLHLELQSLPFNTTTCSLYCFRHFAAARLTSHPINSLRFNVNLAPRSMKMSTTLNASSSNWGWVQMFRSLRNGKSCWKKSKKNGG